MDSHHGSENTTLHVQSSARGSREPTGADDRDSAGDRAPTLRDGIYVITEEDDGEEDDADERTRFKTFETKEENSTRNGHSSMCGTRCTYRYHLPPPKPPPNYLIPAIVLMLFNLPLGSLAVAYSLMSIRNFNKRRFQQANAGSTNALILLIAGIISFTLIATTIFIILWETSDRGSEQPETEASLEVTTPPGEIRTIVMPRATTIGPRLYEDFINETRQWLDSIGVDKPKGILRLSGIHRSRHRLKHEGADVHFPANLTESMTRNITLAWLDRNSYFSLKRPRNNWLPTAENGTVTSSTRRQWTRNDLLSWFLKRLNETGVDIP